MVKHLSHPALDQSPISSFAPVACQMLRSLRKQVPLIPYPPSSLVQCLAHSRGSNVELNIKFHEREIVFLIDPLVLISNEVSIVINHLTCPKGFHAAKPFKSSKCILQI